MRYRIRRRLLPPRSSPRPISSLLLLPAPLPAEPCRLTGRLKARRHPTSYPLRLASPPCLLARFAPSHRLISSAHPFRPLLACFTRRTPSPSASRPMLLIHLIRPPHLIRFISRPVLLPAHASRRASSLASPHFSPCVPPDYSNRQRPIIPPHPMRQATSKTEQRTERAIDDGQGKRHEIRHLPDDANTYPRPPYRPYEPHDARILPRTRPKENAPYMPLTTPLTGNTR